MQILNDFQTTVSKALSEIDPKWRDYKGLIICGTHAPHDIEYMIGEIRKARESNIPFLGICFGHQLAAIEYARNVLGQADATSEEFAENKRFKLNDYVVYKLPQLKVGLHDGETYWNNYEVSPDFLSLWRIEPNFFTCQFHPEYGSSIDKPHPLLVSFLEYASKNSA